LFGVAGMALCFTAQAKPPFVHDYARPFNQYTWVTSHNAFNNGRDYGDVVPGQSRSVKDQLELGVRGLMLDLYDSNGEIRVCHVSCKGNEKTFASYLANDIVPFLRRDGNAVVSLMLEEGIGKAGLAKAFAQVSLGPLAFDPNDWTSNSWPTLQDMIVADKRLLIFSLNSSSEGDYATKSSSVHVMAAKSATVENYWSLGDTVFVHDYTCKSRWADVPLGAENVAWAGKRWPRLFVMNQFHGVSFAAHSRLDNRYDKLENRDEAWCRAESNRKPNFIAIDHVGVGDAFQYAGVLNGGGIVLYEGPNVSQNIVCGIPTEASLKDDFQSPTLGCENDEAKSARLHRVAKGTVITLFDSPSQKRNDDFVVITALRDIGTVDVDSFEQATQNADIRVDVHYVNGLNGKVSSVDVNSPN
jgi:hypothetical protein